MTVPNSHAITLPNLPPLFGHSPLTTAATLESFNDAELDAIIVAAWREQRRRSAPTGERGQIVRPGLVLDASRRTAVWRDTTYVLSGAEFVLLQLLAEAYPAAVTRNDISMAYWRDLRRSDQIGPYLHQVRKRMPGLIYTRSGGKFAPGLIWLGLTETDRQHGKSWEREAAS